MTAEVVGLAQLPALTVEELVVLLGAVDARLHAEMAAEGRDVPILWSLSTAVSETIYAAHLDGERRRELEP